MASVERGLRVNMMLSFHLREIFGLVDAPQRVSGHDAPRQRGAIAEDRDQRSQMFQLQTIVEGIAEPMGPVEKRKRDENKKVQPCNGILHQAVKHIIAGGLKPSQR